MRHQKKEKKKKTKLKGKEPRSRNFYWGENSPVLLVETSYTVRKNRFFAMKNGVLGLVLGGGVLFLGFSPLYMAHQSQVNQINFGKRESEEREKVKKEKNERKRRTREREEREEKEKNERKKNNQRKNLTLFHLFAPCGTTTYKENLQQNNNRREY